MCASLALTASAEVQTLITEDFGGVFADDLNGSTADVFSSDITTAGGSSTWSASTEFQQDGTVDNWGSHGSAFLSLGSYVNALKGDASAIFTLKLDVTLVDGGNGITSSDFISLGFYEPGIATGDAFYSQNEGVGTVVFREGGGSTNNDFFGSNGATTGVNVGDFSGVNVTHTLALVLDLTTHNGVSDFGSISLYVDGVLQTYNGGADTSISFLADEDFAYLGFSNANNGGGIVDNFGFYLGDAVTVPEPGTYALIAGALGLVFVALRRRAV